MEKILVIGCGLLGSRLISKISSNANYKVVGADILEPEKDIEFYKLDITNIYDANKIIEKIKPELVIHTAAFTDVDGCEVEREKAWKINVDGTKNIGKACKKEKTKLIYVSTDFVFDGKKSMYREEDDVNPLGYYGLTKLEGEKALAELDIEYAIARTSVLFGWNKRKLNYVTWLIKELSEKRNVKIVNDQYNSPTFADSLALPFLKIYEKNKFEIFHTSGSERISRYEFALKIADIFNLEKNLIMPISSDMLKQRAKRPSDSSLCVEKLEKILNIKMPNVEQMLKEMHHTKRFIQ
ncbi:MAG: dTDP-4-dehydrorhamnose reductase [Candidatus Thermoplasmatota archaeon]